MFGAQRKADFLAKTIMIETAQVSAGQ